MKAAAGNAGRLGHRGRVQAALILVIALASLGGSYALFYLAHGGGLWGTTNNGRFVDPPIHAFELELLDANGAPTQVTGHWWIWLVSLDACENSCAAGLERLPQLHTLLHKEAARVRHAVLWAGADAPPRFPAVSDPDLVVLTTAGRQLAPGAYVVDPLGNLVLWYSYEDVGKPLLDDLKKLLKVSQIG